MLELISPLASLLGIEAEALADRLKGNIAVWALVGAFGAIACVFLLIAANTALSFQAGPVVAPLVIAGAALLVALTIYLFARIRTGIIRRIEANQRRSAETTALVTNVAVAALPVMLTSPLFKRVGIPAAGVLAAAYFLSRPTSSRK